ncbi:hypothetical protein CK203_020967 [Vitis vinifera]|uniref:Uncharacterized protein n=1 Tax=Vitis vinifera TaxID=29760 RepID=A0A438JWJ7_VITVI|nr:hypothetical protein CK203_020967 [Vitis vinifera]
MGIRDLVGEREYLVVMSWESMVDVAEVMYIVKDLWRGRSAREQSIEHVGRGMWRSVNELMLVRWDQRKPASVSNLILLKFKENPFYNVLEKVHVPGMDAGFSGKA